MFKWVEGRQKTGYRIMKLFEFKWPLRSDAYIIHYPVNSYIDDHTDPVEGYRHYRCNLTLSRAKQGGGLSCKHPIFTSRHLTIFRSDYPHRVYKIREGSRWVLSLGLCLRDKVEK